MKAIVTATSNTYFTEKKSGDSYELQAFLELVIIYTDGKSHEIKNGQLVSEPKLTESRLVVSPEMLQSLITELQLHQKKLENLRHNADQINSLIKHVTNK